MPALHTGLHTATLSAEWTVGASSCRLVVTNPWELHGARELVETQLAGLGRRPVPRHPPASLIPFPYGLVPAAPDAEPHHRADPPPIAPDAFETDVHWARVAQHSAEQVAETGRCGALVALGGYVATSGLAPVGGWRIALGDTVVAIDGGAVALLNTAHPRRRPGRLVVPATGRTVWPSWRSVAVAAADAAAAGDACAGALLRGDAGPGWLDGLGLPARLVHVAGFEMIVGRWPG